MKYIDNRRLKLPQNWSKDAAKALEESSGSEKNINDHSDVWRDLKKPLSDLSKGKCWYCECFQERSDNAVDHFRPKGRVKDAEKPHDGYWWLAFDKRNYRYSCTFCNSRRKNPATGRTQGKGDSFPLIDEGKRGYKPNDEIYENPALLDPCRAPEPGWLDFLDDGTPCAKYKDHEIKSKKAELSIFFYHLDHQEAVESRRKIAIEIESWIEQGNLLYEQLGKGNIAIENAFDGVCRSIITTMQQDAPYSAFATHMVKGHKELEWIDDLL